MLPSILLSTVLVALSTTPTSALTIPNLFRRDLTCTMPSSDLQDPTTISPSVSLKYIALGVGTQNYTCASTPKSASGVPVSQGAKATLYNVGSFLNNNPQFIETLPPLALGYQVMTGGSICPSLGIPTFGNHFFQMVNGVLSPVFDLSAVGARLVGKKLNAVPAPADACAGPGNAGAVPWLQLGDYGSGQSYGGVTYVYRVETAGGNAPATCASQAGTFTVPYAAEYWVYGP